MKAKKVTKEKLIAVLPTGKKEASFFEQVYEVVRQIPHGRVTSYGTIAAFLGARKSARMVGWAMNAAHLQEPPVPAQRVVNRNGMLSGKAHFATPTLMQELLEEEGFIIEKERIINFTQNFLDPVKELSLE